MNELTNRSDAELLMQRIENLVEEAKKRTVAQVNTVMVQTYFEIGRAIVENEQQGDIRAAYGKSVLKELSKHLNAKFGKGFSVDNLENMRRFYLTYSNMISETPSRESENKKSETVSRKSEELTTVAQPKFALSWSHYIFLMKIDNLDERNFYEREAIQERWSLQSC